MALPQRKQHSEIGFSPIYKYTRLLYFYILISLFIKIDLLYFLFSNFPNIPPDRFKFIVMKGIPYVLRKDTPPKLQWFYT